VISLIMNRQCHFAQFDPTTFKLRYSEHAGSMLTSVGFVQLNRAPDRASKMQSAGVPVGKGGQTCSQGASS
jgi:hypothetical protein